MTTIEKLAKKYFEVYGDSPEFSFWGWLDALGVESTEKDLLELLNDTEFWANEK